MRISTNTIYTEVTQTIQKMNQNVLNNQTKLATGIKLKSPSDDPADYAKMLDIQNTISANMQYAKNRTVAQNRITLTESTLTSITTSIMDAQDQGIAGSNGKPNQTLANQVLNIKQTIQGLTNSVGSDGVPMFQSSRIAQVSRTRQMETSTSPEVFNNLLTTLDSLANALSTGNKINLDNAMINLTKNLNTVLGERAILGGRLNELQSIEEFSATETLTIKSQLSTIRDTDYIQTISELNQQMLALEAAHKAFASTAKLSLFNYL